jgi:hypothetical protein
MAEVAENLAELVAQREELQCLREEIQALQAKREALRPVLEVPEVLAHVPNVDDTTPVFQIRDVRNAAGALTFAQTAARIANNAGARARADELEQQTVRENSAARQMGAVLLEAKAFNLKLPSPDRWSGDRATLTEWLCTVQTYLIAKGVDLDSRIAVAYAAALLAGSAAAFWRMHSQRAIEGSGPSVLTFASFHTLLFAQFLPEDRETMARAKLRKLAQVGDVKSYNDAFSKLIVDLPHRHERDTVDDYIMGLKHELRTPVMMQFPTRLDWAMQLAVQISETWRQSKALGRGFEASSSKKPTEATGQDSSGKGKGKWSGKTKTRVPKDTCAACGQKGHWARNCPAKGASSSGKAQ